MKVDRFRFGVSFDANTSRLNQATGGIGGAEIYFEYGWNDGSSNLRDLTLDNSHSSASILGIKKIQPLSKNSFLNFHFVLLFWDQVCSMLCKTIS